MSEDAKRRLERLLTAHAAKVQKSASDAVEKAVVHSTTQQQFADDAAEKARVDFERMQEFLAVRDKVLKPLATALAAQLLAGGHRAEVATTDPAPQSLYACAREGRLSLTFGLQSSSRASVLTFMGFPGAVQTQYDYSFPGGRSTTLYGREFPPIELTTKVAEDIFLDFLTKVLDETFS